jgi:hypothetical protein
MIYPYIYVFYFFLQYKRVSIQICIYIYISCFFIHPIYFAYSSYHLSIFQMSTVPLPNQNVPSTAKPVTEKQTDIKDEKNKPVLWCVEVIRNVNALDWFTKDYKDVTLYYFSSEKKALECLRDCQSNPVEYDDWNRIHANITCEMKQVHMDVYIPTSKTQ